MIWRCGRLAFWIVCGLSSSVCPAQTFSLLNQTINAYAGTSGTASYTGDSGLAASATLSAPGSIAFDFAGNLYIADTANNVVRKVTQAAILQAS